ARVRRERQPQAPHRVGAALLSLSAPPHRADHDRIRELADAAVLWPSRLSRSLSGRAITRAGVSGTVQSRSAACHVVCNNRNRDFPGDAKNAATGQREMTAGGAVLLVGPYDPHCGEYTFLAPPLGVW